MQRLTILIGSFLLVLFLMVPVAVAEERLRLATTTSTENSGLLEKLIPPFEKANNARVDVISVGTGKALKLGETGDVDVVLVHARKLEDQFVAAGFGVDRRDVMYNDFVILGPKVDPAEIAGLENVRLAMQAISVTESVFISRGDLSGTHTREKELWEAAGVQPKGAWYLEAGRGMGEVITMTDERQGYTLADRGTYLAYRVKTDLVVLVEDDKRLFNPYGVILVNPERHPHVNFALASAFADYLTSSAGQSIINGFHKDGEALFHAHHE